MDLSASQPRFDQPALDLSSSKAESDYDGFSNSHIASTDDGMGSLYTYNSSGDVMQFVKEMNGRFFNAQNDTYVLPSGKWPLTQNGLAHNGGRT